MLEVVKNVKSDEITLHQNGTSIITSSNEFIKHGFILSKHKNGYFDGFLECPSQRFLKMLNN